MRLGATRGGGSDGKDAFRFRAETAAELDAVAQNLDQYGLSAIVAPIRTLEMSDAECAEYGEKAAELDLVISEVHFLGNVLARADGSRGQAIEDGRALLRKADLMGARCMLGLPGSLHPGGTRYGEHRWGVCAENFSEVWRSEMREVVLRILDGMELTSATFDLEPERNVYFYQPEECAQFFEDVDHPKFGFHLDMMNMVSQASLFKTTELIDRTFELLGHKMHSAHLKDIQWDPVSLGSLAEGPSGRRYRVFVKLDEVLIGEGELDYRRYLSHLAKMDADFPCICEHLVLEEDYIANFKTVQHLAAEIGAEFVKRRAS